MTGLILVSTLGGIFTMTLGFSRILYAAGAEGKFFSVFGRVHPTGRFPTVSLLAISAISLPLCWLSLGRLLSAFMILQIVFQFIPQILAVFAIRKYRKGIALPFRMWLYPVPALLALVGWIYVAVAPEQRQNIATAVILLLAGLVAYFFWSRTAKIWPFGEPETTTAAPAAEFRS